MPKWGWYAFLFFSFLSAASAFKFVPPGLMQGFFPSLGDGLPAAWTAFVEEGHPARRRSRGPSHRQCRATRWPCT
jgi:hypothetical protein